MTTYQPEDRPPQGMSLTEWRLQNLERGLDTVNRKLDRVFFALVTAALSIATATIVLLAQGGTP